MTLQATTISEVFNVPIVKSVEFGDLSNISELKIRVSTKQTTLSSSRLLTKPTRLNVTAPPAVAVSITDQIKSLQEKLGCPLISQLFQVLCSLTNGDKYHNETNLVLLETTSQGLFWLSEPSSSLFLLLGSRFFSSALLSALFVQLYF